MFFFTILLTSLDYFLKLYYLQRSLSPHTYTGFPDEPAPGAGYRSSSPAGSALLPAAVRPSPGAPPALRPLRAAPAPIRRLSPAI